MDPKSRINADIIDLGILTLCSHVITSYGTFGFWATLLSKSKTHILPKTTTSIDCHDGERIILEETLGIMSSGFNSHFIFIDDILENVTDPN